MHQTNLTQQLLNMVSALPVEISETTAVKLTNYVSLLAKWNKTYNLTAVQTPEEMLSRHIFDSLSIARFINGSQILDFGTGAGLPGIPLALVLPHLHITLLDSNRKKTTFLNHVIMALEMNNATTHYGRVEDFKPDRCFDTIITRATTSLIDFINKTEHLGCTYTHWLAMKGPDPEAEITAAQNKFPNYKFSLTKLLVLPDTPERTLVTITPKVHQQATDFKI